MKSKYRIVQTLAGYEIECMLKGGQIEFRVGLHPKPIYDTPRNCWRRVTRFSPTNTLEAAKDLVSILKSEEFEPGKVVWESGDED